MAKARKSVARRRSEGWVEGVSETSPSPDFAKSYQKGIDLLIRDRAAEAGAVFQDLVRKRPKHPGAVHYLGVALMRLNQFAEAQKLIEHSIRLTPDRAEFHHNLGAVHRALGRFGEAEKSYRRAIELKPDYAEAWFNYSAVKRFRSEEDAALLGEIEAELKQESLSEIDREFLHFAAGKIADDQGNYDAAFGHYRKGNQLRGHEFDRAEFLELIDRLERVFPVEAFQKTTGSDSEEPIFIVGMPRSGTTLVEQMLASHPAVEGAGELPDIRAIAGTIAQHTGGVAYPENVTTLTESAFGGFAVHYLKLREPLRGPETQRIIDKMPSNFLHVGLIRLLFPRAKVVHLVRDPRDTCLSCWFQRFRTGHEYSADLGDLGFYYRIQERLMRHWKSVLPGFVHTLHYEQLVEEPEPNLRALLDFCGLDWDDACLRFHETKRAVLTASNQQVRTPLNRRGLARWKNYEAHLTPLIAALDEFAQ